ncbi:MAG: hypothetical protein QXQ86_03935 [Sulfolobales archaeon]
MRENVYTISTLTDARRLPDGELEVLYMKHASLPKSEPRRGMSLECPQPYESVSKMREEAGR